MKKVFLFCVLTLLAAPSLKAQQQGVDTLSLKSIFYEPLLAGHRPNFVQFSPDGKSIYYQKNDSAMADDELFTVTLNGRNARQAPEDFERGYRRSPDGTHLAYVQEGDIWVSKTDFSDARRIIQTSENEYDLHWSPNSQKLAFVQDGQVWVAIIGKTGLQQITNRPDQQLSYSIDGWAGNNQLVLHQYDSSDAPEYYFPEYVDEYVRTGASRRGIAEQTVTVARLDSAHIQLAKGKEFISTSASADGRYVALDRIDPARKNRVIEVYDMQQRFQDSTVVFENSTDGWFYNTNMAFAPQGHTLMLQSEQDGWNHIYTVESNGANLTQQTDGSYEVPWAGWTDKNSIVFASTKVDPGERQLYRLNTQSQAITPLTSETGYRNNFRLSDDKRRLVYSYSYFNTPFELYSLNLGASSPSETRLTQTIPDRFKAIDWQQEDYLRFTGRDGSTEISMSVLEPLNKQQGRQYPVVVFVHGAGSLQNVYKGWSTNYYREYMFHQYLTARGYYVMEVDYRHSTGYGRDFRDDVTGWMGKYETHDIVDGIKHLSANYPQADTSRVGTYGGSYGGFMALYATSVAPDYFDAAAALRAVTNWENYYYTNPWYTRPRLGTPEADSANYARSSPITYVDELEQPVLILHGLEDNNVGFQDAAQYIDKLIQTGNKTFDMMMYPTERHSFQDPDAWFDEYSRIFEFFEEQLK